MFRSYSGLERVLNNYTLLGNIDSVTVSGSLCIFVHIFWRVVIHFWKGQTFLKPKTNCSICTENVFGAILHLKWTPSNMCIDNISEVKQYRNSILVDMPTFLVVGKGWIDEQVWWWPCRNSIWMPPRK